MEVPSLPNFRRREVEVSHNVKIKQYLDGFKKFTYASRHIFIDPGWEDSSKPLWQETVSKPKDRMEQRDDNTKRAIEKIFDIAYLNRFDYMVTLTIDPNKLDRYDPRQIAEKVKSWCRNRVQRNDMRYLIVPELHEDGAVHMHGLVSGDLKYIDSGTVKVPGVKKPIKRQTALDRGYDLASDDVHTVFNMPQWSYGWSTAVLCYGDVSNAARYMCKYVTKDLKKIFGNFYYAGGQIKRDPDIDLSDIRYADAPGTDHYIPQGRISFKYGMLKDGMYIEE